MKAGDDVIPDVDLREACDAEGCVAARFVQAGGDVSPTGLLIGHLHISIACIVIVKVDDATYCRVAALHDLPRHDYVPI